MSLEIKERITVPSEVELKLAAHANMIRECMNAIQDLRGEVESLMVTVCNIVETLKKTTAAIEAVDRRAIFFFGAGQCDGRVEGRDPSCYWL